jgi:hypothetical protein
MAGAPRRPTARPRPHGGLLPEASRPASCARRCARQPPFGRGQQPRCQTHRRIGRAFAWNEPVSCPCSRAPLTTTCSPVSGLGQHARFSRHADAADCSDLLPVRDLIRGRSGVFTKPHFDRMSNRAAVQASMDSLMSGSPHAQVLAAGACMRPRRIRERSRNRANPLFGSTGCPLSGGLTWFSRDAALQPWYGPSGTNQLSPPWRG